MKKTAIFVLFIIVLCLLCACNPTEPTHTTYTVTFDSQGGSAVDSQTIIDGNPVKRPQTPTREGYFLNGWYTSSATTADTEWHFDTDRVTKDMTLYAGWTVETSQEATSSLVFVKEGNAYTVTDMEGEETVVIIPSEYNGLAVTKIQGAYGTGAFARKAITSVTIPDSIEEIGQNSFNNCGALTTVNISTASRLKKIGNNAFSGNSSLKEIYLPVGMTDLGDSVFNNCGAIARFIVSDGNTAYISPNGHLVERATNTLIRGANNSEIPDGVKVIASAAFRKSAITKLEIPNSVQSIENYIIQDSAVEEIIYRGTEQDWQAIAKAKLWNVGKTDVSVKFEPKQEEITKMYITIYGNKLEVTLENNSSVKALVELLKQRDITYTADDYGGFEKVGSIGHSLPTNNSQITTEAGDVILYQGSQICIMVGSNSWSYTRIGKIKGYSVSELKNLVGSGKGSTEVTLSLN